MTRISTRTLRDVNAAREGEAGIKRARRDVSQATRERTSQFFEKLIVYLEHARTSTPLAYSYNNADLSVALDVLEEAGLLFIAQDLRVQIDLASLGDDIAPKSKTTIGKLYLADALHALREARDALRGKLPKKLVGEVIRDRSGDPWLNTAFVPDLEQLELPTVRPLARLYRNRGGRFFAKILGQVYSATPRRYRAPSIPNPSEDGYIVLYKRTPPAAARQH